MDKNTFLQTYCGGFSSQQLEALCSEAKHILLLAVPGSGKTTVLIHRLGYMVKVRGIAPEKILTVTYTVAATRDMNRRYDGLFGQEPTGNIEFRTINGICAKIISHYGSLIGKTAFELVTDEKLLGKLLADIYTRRTNLFPTESDLKSVKTVITYIKNSMLTEAEIKEYGKKELGASFPLLEVYGDYQAELKKNSWMDYDDQMLYAYRILQSSPQMLEQYQNRYPYICVDEAQDTSKIQHCIIKLLVGTKGQLFMVGDEDQSIYGFRAAYPKALLDFTMDYPGAQTLLMEENYRCDGNIVAVADRFIQKNQMRYEKHMTAAREKKEKLHFIALNERSTQYKYLLHLAKEAKNMEGDVAVLYREHESVLPLVDLLERRGIDYQVRAGDITFFSNRVVGDVTAMLQFALNPYDTQLFMQIYYKLGTYLKKEEAIRVCNVSNMEHLPVLAAAAETPGLKDSVYRNCKNLQLQFRQLLNDRPQVAIKRLVFEMGYTDYLERNSLDTHKIYLLRVLAGEENTIAAFLERLQELEGILREKESYSTCKFKLSTIHASKGLEYNEVYLLDVIDGLFPEDPSQVSVSYKSDAGRDSGNKLFATGSKISAAMEEYEQERRLFYVAMTRAKDRLHIFQYKDYPSCFIKELQTKERQEIPIRVGDEVEQLVYGHGRVVETKLDKSGQVSKFMVRFVNGQTKTFANPDAFTKGGMELKNSTR